MDKVILKSRRNSLIALLIVATFCQGWLSAAPVENWIWTLTSLSTGLAMTALLITLSQLNGRPLLRSYHWMIYLVWPLFLPFFILVYYRWKGLGILALALIAYGLLLYGGLMLALLLT